MKINESYDVNHPEFNSLTILSINKNKLDIICHGGKLDNWLCIIDKKTFKDIQSGKTLEQIAEDFLNAYR